MGVGTNPLCIVEQKQVKMKKLYFIDYDLRKERNYQTLYDELNRLKAIQVLESCWCLKIDGSSTVEIRDHFKKFIDANDGIMVSEISDWASYNTNGHPNQL